MLKRTFTKLLGLSLALFLVGCSQPVSSNVATDSNRYDETTVSSDKDDEDDDRTSNDESDDDEDDDSDKPSLDDKEADSDNTSSAGNDEDDESEPEPAGDSDIDLSDLTSKHGRTYVYNWVGTETLYDGVWEFSECDGLIYDEERTLQRTLTIYRYSDTSAIEYMIESAGEWGEFWHVNYDYPADCVYFDTVENGYVTVSGDTAVWNAEWGDYREIYKLSETFEFDDN